MNKNNLIFVLACAALIAKAKPALAADDGAKPDAEIESQQLDHITDTLKDLAQAGAIEITTDGQIVIKKSVTDRLRDLGRLDTKSAAFSSICSGVGQ